MIHFDLEDRYQDEPAVGNAISRREAVLLSIIVHLVVLLIIQFSPRIPFFQLSPEEEAQRQAELRRQEQPREQPRFVFVQPRAQRPSQPPPPRADLSDQDQRAQALERAPQPTDVAPFSRGDSPEPVVQPSEAERRQGPETPLEPDTTPPQPEPQEQLARALPPAEVGLRNAPRPSRPAPGALGDALRNLERYVQNQTFRNPQGGANDPGSTIQFDTKGVEFGPWVRRFVSQVRRNWFIPNAAMSFRGRVVVQFNIHKDGHITDVMVASPSNIDAFNRAAYNAILGSNPTEPLPPESPDPVMFITVTFYYNEQPPV